MTGGSRQQPRVTTSVGISREQRLWLLTAHPDTWMLTEAPAWLANECEALGLVDAALGNWKLTVLGHQVWRESRGPL
jgi:hypothetical protein